MKMQECWFLSMVVMLVSDLVILSYECCLMSRVLLCGFAFLYAHGMCPSCNAAWDIVSVRRAIWNEATHVRQRYVLCRNETHERMFLRTDMGKCRVQHESLCGCFSHRCHHSAWWNTRTHPWVKRFVSLVDDVCSNPLHDERETHEHMFLYALPPQQPTNQQLSLLPSHIIASERYEPTVMRVLIS